MLIPQENSFWIDLTFENDAMFETGFGEITKVVTSDHRELTHRGAPMQHPIDSITDLTDELEVRPDESLSNIDIYEILQH